MRELAWVNADDVNRMVAVSLFGDVFIGATVAGVALPPIHGARAVSLTPARAAVSSTPARSVHTLVPVRIVEEDS